MLPYFKETSHSTNNCGWAQQKRVDKAEDGDIHADSQRQGDDYGSIRPGLLHHHAHAEANVSPPLRRGEKAALGALGFLKKSHVAELAARGSGGVGAGDALATIALGEGMEVSVNLLVELVVLPFLGEEADYLCRPNS